MTDQPEITQADREAAIILIGMTYEGQKAFTAQRIIRSSKGDASHIVQAFARHRIATEQSQSATIERLEAEIAELREGSVLSDLEACDRAIERMGWDEIKAFHAQPGQSPYEDAGGFLLRRIKALFGLKPTELETYQQAARRLVNEARRQTLSTTEGGR